MVKGSNQVPSFKNSSRWFKSAKVSGQSPNVDRENGIIKNVVVAQVGPAAGHGTNVEQQFINGLVAQGNQITQGVKVRFGHPSMSAEALGTYAGRAFNFSVRDNQAIADIHLSSVAQNAPGKGDMYNYLLDMAEKEPDMFGMSVVTCGNWLYQYDDEGNMYSEEDEDWYDKYTSTRPLYEMFESFLAVDFVEEGALTPNGLFSAELNKDKFAVSASSFLDSNPNIDEFIKSNPLKIIEFMSNRFGLNIPKTQLQQFTSLFNNSMTKPNSKLNKTEKEKFGNIDATAADGQKLVIIAAGDAPAVGDEVQLEDGSAAPDGDYDITDGDLAGQTIGVLDGKIGEIATPKEEASEGEKAKGPKEPATQMSAEEWSKKFNDLESKFSALQQENEELKKRPKSAFSATAKTKDILEAEDKRKKPVASYNKKAQEIAERQKNNKYNKTA